jgi:microcystin-dependent protein
MPDPITRIVFRRGLYTEKSNLVLLQGEPGYTTDSKRLFIGDGTTFGGVPVGMRNLGIATFGSTSTNLNATQINYRGQPGDIIFDTVSNCVWSLTGTDPGLVASYVKYAASFGPDNTTTVENGGIFSVKQGGLNATYLTSGMIGRGLERITGNTILRIADPSTELTFLGNSLSITDAGVSNAKLANVVANTVKGRLNTAGSPTDIPITTLASVLAPYVTPQVNSVPPGAVLDFAGNTPPAGYLLCDGSAVSRTTYSTLFGVIGTTWGAGNGTTTFNLPDLRRRVTVGSGGTPTSTIGSSIGSIGGAETHTLTEAQIPSHTHTGGAFWPTARGTGPEQNQTSGPEDYTRFSNTGATGGSQAHNNIQPSAIVHKIIKT